MPFADLAKISGNTADINKALFKAANNLPDNVPDSVVNKATLADMLLARAASMLIFTPGHLETLGAKIQTTLENPKSGIKLDKEEETALSTIALNTNNRQSLEKYFIQYATSRSAETQALVKEMMEGKISPDALLNKLKELDQKSSDLTQKINTHLKTYEELERKLEKIIEKIPGGEKELRKLLNPDQEQPKLSS